MRAPRGPFALLTLVALAGIAVAGTGRPGATDSYQAIALYAEAMSIIHDRYVDELPWSKLVQDGIRGAVQGLDLDSTVVAASPTRPATTGAGDVGLALTRRNGGLSVVVARDGMPAQAAGIRTGDRILTLEGEPVRDMAPDAAAAHLRGQPGSTITLTVIRSGWAEPRPFTLTRVKTPRVDMSERALGNGILYVRLPRLDDATAGALAHVLQTTPAEQATGLVLDLRDTLGGRIEAVPAIASLFLDPGCLVARVESRAAGGPTALTTTAAAIRWTRPLAILVGPGTASAAEVLAGAMQDSRRAVIVGAPTFGDATSRSAIPLADGSTLELTTARYLTPERHPITGHGIAPDVVATAASLGADSELELAFEVVKAASILEHDSAGGTGPAPIQAALGRCEAPAS
ncbi:MAG: S41 family peptidase [Candidatus Rokuibacteriota bacterium]